VEDICRFVSSAVLPKTFFPSGNRRTVSPHRAFYFQPPQEVSPAVRFPNGGGPSGRSTETKPLLSEYLKANNPPSGGGYFCLSGTLPKIHYRKTYSTNFLSALFCALDIFHFPSVPRKRLDRQPPLTPLHAEFNLGSAPFPKRHLKDPTVPDAFFRCQGETSAGRQI